MTKINERIRNRRKALGLTQKEVGNKIMASEFTISKYERGKNNPDPETICKLADVLECTTDYLLCKTDDPGCKVYYHDNVSVEINNDYPYDLTPSEVEKLISLLKDYRFDINSLIKDVKSKKIK